MPRHLLVLALSGAFSFACDPGGPTPSELEAKQKADENRKAEEEAMAKRKAEREAKENSEKETADALAAQIDALAVLPEPMPKDLKKVCDARAKAEDDFMTKNFEGEAVAKWNAAKGTQLGFAKQSCIKVGKIEIPACQINALDKAPGELKKNLPDLLKRCIDKFGGAPGGDQVAAGLPPK